MMMRLEAEGAACGLEGGWLRALAEGGWLRGAARGRLATIVIWLGFG